MPTGNHDYPEPFDRGSGSLWYLKESGINHRTNLRKMRHPQGLIDNDTVCLRSRVWPPEGVGFRQSDPNPDPIRSTLMELSWKPTQIFSLQLFITFPEVWTGKCKQILLGDVKNIFEGKTGEELFALPIHIEEENAYIVYEVSRGKKLLPPIPGASG